MASGLGLRSVRVITHLIHALAADARAGRVHAGRHREPVTRLALSTPETRQSDATTRKAVLSNRGVW